MTEKQLFSVGTKEESLKTFTPQLMDSRVTTNQPGRHLTGREAIELGFYFDANKQVLINCVSTEPSIVLPTSIGGINVLTIRANAFRSCNVEHLELPKKLITIEPLGCTSLKSIVFNEGLRVISDHTFCNNKLTNIILPDSLDYCGSHAFYNNELESVSFGKTDFGANPFTYNIGVKFKSRSTKYSDLGGCGIHDLIWNKVIVCTDPSKIPSDTKVMGQFSLSNTFEKRVTLPYGVVALDDFFIMNSAIEEIYVPDTVTASKEESFSTSEMTRGFRGAKVLGPKHSPLHLKSQKHIYDIDYNVV